MPVVLIIILLVLLLLLRVGVSVQFGREQRVELRVGPVKKALFPKAKEERGKPPKKGGAKPKKAKLKPTMQEGIDLIRAALTALRSALKCLKRSVRFKPLELSVLFGGDDPADVAKVYGYANAAVWSIMPLAEETFDIPNPSIHLEADFQKARIEVEGEVGVLLRVGDILLIALVLLVPLVKWYLRFQKAHRVEEPKTKTKETSEKTV